MEYVLSTPALLMLLQEAVVSNMAVAARRYARWKAAALLSMHVASVENMEPVGRASLMAAQPMHNLYPSIAANTAAVVITSRALWRDATQLLFARVSAPNTAMAEEPNAGL